MNAESNNKDYSKTNRIKIHQPDADKADRFNPVIGFMSVQSMDYGVVYAAAWAG